MRTRTAIDIAPTREALTFARVEEEGRHRLLLVTRYEKGAVGGVDLTAALGSHIDDPIEAYAAQGYDALAAFAGTHPSVIVSASSLTLPVRLTASHIAVGTNFPEHAEEATVRDGPFLFPKEVTPTAFDAPVSTGGGLLDYEVELCFVALADIDLDARLERAGLLLCNDFTDRAALLRHVDPGDIVSGKGFTTGKSAPGFMPVGNLFVIPRDLRRFAAAIELRLHRNGKPMQSARQSEAIWDIDELLRQTQARRATRWAHQGRMVGLALADGRVPARTAILGGTPAGTIFNGIGKSTMLLGLWDWLMAGWGRPVTHWIVERHIAKELPTRRYLNPGERVHIAVDYLGEIDSAIVN